MPALIVLLVIVGVVAFVLRPKERKTEIEPIRIDYLREMARYYEGRLEPLPTAPDDYRVTFDFEGRTLIFEESGDEGFYGRTERRGLLRICGDGGLSLSLVEKKDSGLRSTAYSMSDLAAGGGLAAGFILPKGLDVFQVRTNSLSKAAALLGNPEVAKVFEAYKYRDARGRWGEALEIVKGDLLLHFYAQDRPPALFEIRNEFHRIEEHAQRLDVVIEELDRQEQLDVLRRRVTEENTG